MLKKKIQWLEGKLSRLISTPEGGRYGPDLEAMWLHTGEYLLHSLEFQQSHAEWGPERGEGESQKRCSERKVMLPNYQDKIAAQEKRVEEAVSLRNSQDALSQGRLKVCPKCPRTPVVFVNLTVKWSRMGSLLLACKY